MTYEIEVEDRVCKVSVRAAPEGGWWISVDGSDEVRWSGQQVGAAEWLLSEGGAARTVGVYVDGDHADIQVEGHALRAKVSDPRKRGLDATAGAGEGTISTPMPGVIARIPVVIGQTVSVGELVIVVEAMKMENEYKSPIDGVILNIPVEAGQSVEANTVLVVVEPS